MNSTSKLAGACFAMVAAIAIGCMQPGPASAGVQDSVFFTSPDGNSIAFDVREVSRKEVLDRLLANRAIELEWVDTGFGDEKISGTFKGSADAVLQRLLAQTDFVVVYDGKADKSRISRLIIVGKASSQSRQAALPALPGLTATTPAGPSDQALRPFSAPADFRPPTAAELAMPLITPPPPGMTAPQLVPPSPSEAAAPLWTPAPTTTR